MIRSSPAVLPRVELADVVRSHLPFFKHALEMAYAVKLTSPCMATNS